MAKLETIKFNAERPEVVVQQANRVKVTLKPSLDLIQFSKGLGPCGRWVTDLEYVIDLATLRIKQTSYPMDLEPLRASYMEAMSEYRKSHPEFKKRREVIAIKAGDELSAAIETRKVETFIYKLEDVRGRIHAVLEVSG